MAFDWKGRLSEPAVPGASASAKAAAGQVGEAPPTFGRQYGERTGLKCIGVRRLHEIEAPWSGV